MIPKFAKIIDTINNPSEHHLMGFEKIGNSNMVKGEMSYPLDFMHNCKIINYTLGYMKKFSFFLSKLKLHFQSCVLRLDLTIYVCIVFVFFMSYCI